MLKISQKLNFWWSILYYLSISIYQSFFLSLPFRILSLSPLVFLTFCSSSASFFLSIFFIIFLFFVACPQLTISGIGLIYAFTAPLFSSPSCCCIVSYRTVAVIGSGAWHVCSLPPPWYDQNFFWCHYFLIG